ncbi:GGDEF domain-containing protein [Pseudomonas neustonica]|uniref:diguanylate cyclase n=1 Tax=Pseudomonas neustonica TaxID=2487346 RepID=A0ABX9XKW8_9PSED|nr:MULTISPECIES: GGDEF domain-containing protein [Pseudomonas]MBA6418412.1 GGDEF domain-containing protein [Pseudomonas sp. 5Ae-yellow]ROZ85677.1 GGDEF domain-containing protein [Pseudomonas sp. SSM44]ROZ87430.1 GGDEF domain-containing protein [Pseudomonas neustonica]|tara:strand:- start:13378 stop:14427 length:1050 start_codon:yes stop_codon:yes gene_type:complete
MAEQLEQDQSHRRSVLRALLWLTLLFGFTFAGLNIYRGLYLLAAIEVAYALFSFSLLPIIPKTKHLDAWTIAFLVPFFCIMVFALVLPNTSFTVFAWIQTIPIISYLLLGQRGGLWMSCIFISAAIVAFNVRYITGENAMNALIVTNLAFSSLAVMLFSHIYERSRTRNEARLIELAGTDSLTGIANRMRMGEEFTRLRSQAERSAMALSLVVLDVDKFKHVNDQYGHETGDRALQHIAGKLSERLRGSDMVCRLGGEEFALLLLGADHQQAAKLADHLRQQVFATPLKLNGTELQISFSGGVATLSDDGDDLSTLLKVADQRMYEAKSSGRNRIVSAHNPVPESLVSS